MKRREVSRSKVMEIINISVQKVKVGITTYLHSYEEELVVASAEIEGSHGMPIGINTLASELKLFIKADKTQQSTKNITDNSSFKYTHSVIKQVNSK